MIKSVRETVKNEAKEQKGAFLDMLLGARILGNMLAGAEEIRRGEGENRASPDF